MCLFELSGHLSYDLFILSFFQVLVTCLSSGLSFMTKFDEVNRFILSDFNCLFLSDLVLFVEIITQSYSFSHLLFFILIFLKTHFITFFISICLCLLLVLELSSIFHDFIFQLFQPFVCYFINFHITRVFFFKGLLFFVGCHQFLLLADFYFIPNHHLLN